jgi:hypothetical protein
MGGTRPTSASSPRRVGTPRMRNWGSRTRSRGISACGEFDALTVRFHLATINSTPQRRDQQHHQPDQHQHPHQQHQHQYHHSQDRRGTWRRRLRQRCRPQEPAAEHFSPLSAPLLPQPSPSPSPSPSASHQALTLALALERLARAPERAPGAAAGSGAGTVARARARHLEPEPERPHPPESCGCRFDPPPMPTVFIPGRPRADRAPTAPLRARSSAPTFSVSAP